MRNLLALVGLAVVGFAGAGWYLGWYKVGQQTDAQGHPQLQIQVNPTQVQSDLKKAEQRVLDAAQKIQGSGNPQQPSTTPSYGAPPPPPPPPPVVIPEPPTLPPLPIPVQQPADSWIFPPK